MFETEFDMIRQLTDFFWGHLIWFLLYLGCLVVLFLLRKRWRNAYQMIFWYSIVILIGVCYNPVFTKFTFTRLFEGEMSSYVRIYLLLPIYATVIYVLTELLFLLPKLWRYLLAVVAAVLMVVIGVSPGDHQYYRTTDNPYKIDPEALQICYMLEPREEKRCILYLPAMVDDEHGSNLIWEGIRQYDADVVISPTFPMTVSDEELSSGSFQSYLSKLDSDGSKVYVLCMKDHAVQEAMKACGFTLIGTTDKFYLMEKTGEAAPQIDGEKVYTITQFAQSNGAQGMCYAIRDNEDHLILVDGGFDMNAELVLNMIIDHDNYVDAWIITHPHQDHVSVFNNLMNGNFGFEIGTIYAIDLDYDYYKSVVGEYDGGFEYYEDFLKAVDGKDDVQYVHTGEEYDLFGLDMKILNAYEKGNDLYAIDPANNGSMMFKITGNEQSMLFCADVTANLADSLMEKWGDELKADYLQVAHHGIGGTMPLSFDEFVDPSVVFFDLPEWMNKTEDMNSKPYYDYFTEEGATVYNFGTAPNTVEMR